MTIDTIIYIRTSTEDQDPKNQLTDCLKLVKTNYELIEEKESAWKDLGRPLFEDIKRGIKNQQIKHLIVWDWDRLFRNRKRLISFFEYCKVYGCQVHSFRQKWFEDFYKIPEPFDEIMQNLVLNLMGWLSEDESKKKSERVKIAYQNRKGNWGRPNIVNSKLIAQVLDAKDKGMSVRHISKSIWYYDQNRNKKYISPSSVQKIIKENRAKLLNGDLV